MAKRPAARRTAERLTAVQKALRIMEAVAASKTPMSMVAIERETGLPRPTVHRIVKELIKTRYLERDPVLRLHSEGARLAALAMDVFRARSPRGQRRDILEELADRTGEACYFGLLRGNQLHLVEHVGALGPFGIRYPAGEPLPAHCTAGGKLLLSMLDDDVRDDVLGARPLQRLTERSICDRRRLHAALASIKEKGIGTEDGEHIHGVVGVAVPVPIKAGTVIGALGIAAPAPRLPLADAVALAADLKGPATRLALTFRHDQAG